MRTHIKICGLMRKEDVDLCCRIGADICGFVVEYPVQVPWNLLREQCAELLPAVSRPAKTCVVTGGEREKIISLALELKPWRSSGHCLPMALALLKQCPFTRKNACGSSGQRMPDAVRKPSVQEAFMRCWWTAGARQMPLQAGERRICPSLHR